MQSGTHTFSQDLPQWHFILSRLLLEINMWISGISKRSHHTLLIHATGWRLWLGIIYSKQIYFLWNASEKLDGNGLDIKNKFRQHTVILLNFWKIFSCNRWVSITGKEWGNDIKQNYFPPDNENNSLLIRMENYNEILMCSDSSNKLFSMK